MVLFVLIFGLFSIIFIPSKALISTNTLTYEEVEYHLLTVENMEYKYYDFQLHEYVDVGIDVSYNNGLNHVNYTGFETLFTTAYDTIAFMRNMLTVNNMFSTLDFNEDSGRMFFTFIDYSSFNPFNVAFGRSLAAFRPINSLLVSRVVVGGEVWFPDFTDNEFLYASLYIQMFDLNNNVVYDSGTWGGIDNTFYLGVTLSNEDFFNNGYQAGYQTGYEGGYKKGEADGYSQGYAYGNYDGYSLGKNEGYDEGYDIGYDSGNTVGYNKGKIEGYNSGFNDGSSNDYTIWTIIGGAFVSVGGILDIPILGSITIGHLVLIPLLFGLIYFILGRKKD